MNKPENAISQKVVTMEKEIPDKVRKLETIIINISTALITLEELLKPILTDGMVIREVVNEVKSVSVMGRWFDDRYTHLQQIEETLNRWIENFQL